MLKIEARIKELIEGNSTRQGNLLSDYKRFNCDQIPIFDRSFKQDVKVNNRINHDWSGYIAKTKVGYYLGNGVGVTSDLEDTTKRAEHSGKIRRWKRLNSFDYLIQRVGYLVEACGEAATLSYIGEYNGESVLRVEALLPHETIFAEDMNIRYYQDALDEELTKVEVYDDTDIYFFDMRGNDITLMDTKPHLCGANPLIRWRANEELNNCIKPVKLIIDNLDKAYSDLSSEIEQFRLAYLAAYGVNFSDEENFLENLKKTGFFEINDPEAKIEFITKKLEIQSILSFIEKEEANIARFAETYDSVSDRTGLGQLTNLGIHFLVNPIENNCRRTIPLFKQSLYELFKHCEFVWNAKDSSLAFNHLDLEFTFILNRPKNLIEESQTAKNLVGIVSNRTIHESVLSFTDADLEKERLESEEEKMEAYSNLGAGNGEE